MEASFRWMTPDMTQLYQRARDSDGFVLFGSAGHSNFAVTHPGMFRATCRQTSGSRSRPHNSAPRPPSSSTPAPTSTRYSGGTTFALSRKTASPPSRNYPVTSPGIHMARSPIVIVSTSRWRTYFCLHGGSTTRHDSLWGTAVSLTLNVS